MLLASMLAWSATAAEAGEATVLDREPPPAPRRPPSATAAEAGEATVLDREPPPAPRRPPPAARRPAPFRPRDRSIREGSFTKVLARAPKGTTRHEIERAFENLQHLEGLARSGALSARDARERDDLRFTLLGKRRAGSGQIPPARHFDVPF